MLEHVSVAGLQGFQSATIGTETTGADVDTAGATQSFEGLQVVWPVKMSPGPTQHTRSLEEQ